MDERSHLPAFISPSSFHLTSQLSFHIPAFISHSSFHSIFQLSSHIPDFIPYSSFHLTFQRLYEKISFKKVEILPLNEGDLTWPVWNIFPTNRWWKINVFIVEWVFNQRAGRWDVFVPIDSHSTPSRNSRKNLFTLFPSGTSKHLVLRRGQACSRDSIGCLTSYPSSRDHFWWLLTTWYHGRDDLARELPRDQNNYNL